MEEKNPFDVMNDQITEDLRSSGIDTVSGIDIVSDISQSSLDEALEIVKAHLESGKVFTNAQIDLCAEIILTQLPGHEREWAREIASSNNYPLWLILLAQWRRCHEYGEAAALLVDPDWIQKAEEV